MYGQQGGMRGIFLPTFPPQKPFTRFASSSPHNRLSSFQIDSFTSVSFLTTTTSPLTYNHHHFSFSLPPPAQSFSIEPIEYLLPPLTTYAIIAGHLSLPSLTCSLSFLVSALCPLPCPSFPFFLHSLPCLTSSIPFFTPFLPSFTSSIPSFLPSFTSLPSLHFLRYHFFLP